MESGNFKHDGVTFHYDIVGEGNKHVVLQHGFSDYALGWGDMPIDLSESGYKVAMMDARGHGRSAKPDNGYDLDTFTADMMARIRYLKMDRPVIIGHSMGASMGARAASAYPDLLRAAVLIDPVFRDIPASEKEAAVALRTEEIRNLKKMSHKEILEKTRGKHPTWAQVYINHGAMGKIFMSMNIMQVFNTLDIGWREDLEKISCPVLLVTADVDKGAIVSREISSWIHKKYPNVEILFIPGVGHNIHRENYSATFKGIKIFLDRQF
ncbi:MAG: alpha/beta hydrolase [Anaerolineaceae bacterium]|nr:alpha/beta hydrolase [Anaerolineaceae bacterium]